MPLEGQAVESRQLHVEHKARWAGMRHAREVFVSAGEDLDGVVLGREEIGEACPDRLIVIHYENARFQLSHASRPLSECLDALHPSLGLRYDRQREMHGRATALGIRGGQLAAVRGDD
jgi:hypothetical protein